MSGGSIVSVMLRVTDSSFSKLPEDFATNTLLTSSHHFLCLFFLLPTSCVTQFNPLSIFSLSFSNNKG